MFKIPNILLNLANEDIVVKISDGLDENGSPKFTSEEPVKARVESSNDVVCTADSQKVKISVKAFVFEGHENFKVGMSGECIVKGETHKIAAVQKYEFPGGKVCYYILGLI